MHRKVLLGVASMHGKVLLGVASMHGKDLIRGGVGIGGVGIGGDGVGGDGVWVLCYKVICGRGCRSFCIFICKIEMNENRKTFYLTL